MQLADHHVHRRGRCGRARVALPATRRQVRVIQIADVAVLGIGCQADRVGIGHAVDEPSGLGHEHLHQVAIGRATKILRMACTPDAAFLQALGVQHGLEALASRTVDAHPDPMGGRGPQVPLHRARLPRPPLNTQLGPLGLRRKARIQGLCRLEALGNPHAALRIQAHQNRDFTVEGPECRRITAERIPQSHHPPHPQVGGGPSGLGCHQPITRGRLEGKQGMYPCACRQWRRDLEPARKVMPLSHRPLHHGMPIRRSRWARRHADRPFVHPCRLRRERAPIGRCRCPHGLGRRRGLAGIGKRARTGFCRGGHRRDGGAARHGEREHPGAVAVDVVGHDESVGYGRRNGSFTT